MAFKTKVVLVVLLVALLIGVPPGLSQQSPEDSRGNLYSVWMAWRIPSGIHFASFRDGVVLPQRNPD